MSTLPPATGPGWGGGTWGTTPWGGGLLTGLELLSAIAVSENVVQLVFNRAVYLSNLLDAPDASIASKFAIAPVPGTVGLDGTPARAVSAVLVTYSESPPAGTPMGASLDVTVDRPFTPYSAYYTIKCSGLFTLDLDEELDAMTSKQEFYGLFKEVVAPTLEAPHPVRDFANPQTLSALSADVPATSDNQLGVFQVDPTGDYASDSGIISLKKRIYRRLITVPGGFLHLGPNYGVGVFAVGKRLASNAMREKLAAKAEQQIALEPEVAVVKVRTFSANNGLVRFRILVRTKAGQDFSFNPAFPVAA